MAVKPVVVVTSFVALFDFVVTVEDAVRLSTLVYLYGPLLLGFMAILARVRVMQWFLHLLVENMFAYPRSTIHVHDGGVLPS